jgi:outer membrane protein assembly factor BamD
MAVRTFARRLTLTAAGLSLAVGLSACASGGVDPNSAVAQQQADRFLFERGTESLENRRWLEARDYFRTLVDTYPTSEFRQDAKLGIGDSYLGEERIESDILAASEFREFLRFYPLAERADYAQYRLAMSQIRQVLRPERDQTATRDALRELEIFVRTYPNSQHLPEVLRLQRETRDRLSESELGVGKFYHRHGNYRGAVSRLEELMKSDPQFTQRDAVYFYLAESYLRQDKRAEARPLYEKLVEEFAVSEFLEDARQRLAELDTAAAPDVETASSDDRSVDPSARRE